MIELNKIYNEDCLEGMKRIPDKSVDMILCDLPYGTTACKWDTIIPFEPLWEQYERVIKDDGAIVLTASQPFTTALIASNMKNFCYSWVWDKKFGANFVQAKRQPLKTHEDVVVFSKSGKMPAYNPQMVEREVPYVKSSTNYENTKSKAIPIRSTPRSEEYANSKIVYSLKFPTSQISFSVRVGRGLHPTQKPVALFEYLINTYTREGETILDNCMGSGTTAIASINTNRNFIGFELDETYYDLANERIAKHLIERGD